MDNTNKQNAETNINESRGLIEKEYHENGKMKKLIEYSQNGNIMYISEFDKNGNIIYISEFDENENSIKFNKFNSDGTLMYGKKTYYNSDGTIKLINEFK